MCGVMRRGICLALEVMIKGVLQAAIARTCNVREAEVIAAASVWHQEDLGPISIFLDSYNAVSELNQAHQHSPLLSHD